jgi:putative acetyltransferase
VVASVAIMPVDGWGGAALRSLYVARALRRQGMGARLVGLVEAEARRWGAGYVELWSDTRFVEAHRLYERLGYACGEETRDLHDLSRTVEYYFRKSLTG